MHPISNGEEWSELNVACINDIFKMLANHDVFVCLLLKPSSDAFIKFGMSVFGEIFITQNERASIEKAASETQNKSLKLINSCSKLSNQSIEDLKYKGVPINQIERLVFCSKPIVKQIDQAIKTLSNVVKIPFRIDGIDIERMFVNHFISRINDGERFAKFEIEQFLGWYFLVREKKFDIRLLEHFSITKEEIEQSANIWIWYFEAKLKRAALSEQEVKTYQKMLAYKKVGQMIMVLCEARKSKENSHTLRNGFSRIIQFINNFLSFHPRVISYKGKKTYCDEESYVHICMRHFDDYQVGKNTSKSKIPYDHNDLFGLIGAIQDNISVEIEEHFLKSPDKEFYRVKEKAVPFNGDYFSIRIQPDGRISTFYKEG